VAPGSPPVEQEIKLRLAGVGAGREAVARLGAVLSRPRHFEDNVVFDDSAGGMTGRGCLVRLRRTDEGAVLTYKGPRRIVEGVKARDEIELMVADPDALETVFAGMGFRPVFRYQKYRECHRFAGVEVVIDETPVGAFLEIEGPVAEIHRAAAAMGFAPDDYMTDSYADLFFAAGGTGDMVFP
jgi:adenylate cyclase, class 2